MFLVQPADRHTVQGRVVILKPDCRLLTCSCSILTCFISNANKCLVLTKVKPNQTLSCIFFTSDCAVKSRFVVKSRSFAGCWGVLVAPELVDAEVKSGGLEPRQEAELLISDGPWS